MLMIGPLSGDDALYYRRKGDSWARSPITLIWMQIYKELKSWLTSGRP